VATRLLGRRVVNANSAQAPNASRGVPKQVDVASRSVADFLSCRAADAFFTGTGSGARDGVTHETDHHNAPESKDPGRCCCQGTRAPSQNEETIEMSHQVTSEAAPRVLDGSVPDLTALRTEIDYLDAEILRLVQRRTAVSQTIGQARRAAGGPRVVHGREMAVLDRYRALGPEGHELAMLLLRLGRGRLGH
jgi:chorismate mutase